MKDIEHPFDSNEERWFYFWCAELVREGHIKKFIFQPKSFKLFDEVRFNVTKPMKRVEDKIESKILLEGKEYTPDFKIIWNENHNLVHTYIEYILNGKPTREFISNKLISFIENQGFDMLEFVSYVEIKPDFDQNNMTREFKINQKWMYQKYGIYVNLVIPTRKNKPKLNWFQRTFTPIDVMEEEIYTRKVKTKNGVRNSGDSKLRYQPRTLKEYLNEIS